MSLASDFGLLFILEARDRASEILDKVDTSLDRLGGTAKATADAVRGAGAEIDDSLLRTASGADALDVANARVEAAQAKAAQAATEQAAAERELLAAQEEAAAGADGDAAAQDRLVAASGRLTIAQRESATAARELGTAEKLQSDTAAAAAAKTDTAAEGQKAVSSATKESSAGLGKVTKAAGLVGLGMAAAGYEAVKMAGSFQSATAHLVTDAGESQKNLAMVQAGILKVSTATGQSATAVTDAMYHIESAGYHGAAGLKMLTTVAEGARVGNASLDQVSKTLVGTMNAYGASAGQSTKYMNGLIATTAAGDMRMGDLVSSLSSVTAVAAKAHLPFSQVGGAIATMTAQGMTADRATQDLAHTISSLQNPTNVQQNEMKALGVSALQVSRNLGKAGLTGTLNDLTQAVLRNSKGGVVTLGYYRQMTPAAQGLADQILAGSITTGQLTQAMKGLNPQQAKVITQFKSAATSATGLKQTYSAALSKMMGGTTSMNTALMLTGSHMKYFKNSVNSVANAMSSSSKTVTGWPLIEKQFPTKVDQAKEAVHNTAIAVGTALLPAVTAVTGKIAKVLAVVAEWTAKHRKLTEILFTGVTALAATVAVVGLAGKAFKAVKGTIDSVRDAVKGLKDAYGNVQKALRKLGLLSGQTAAGQEKAAKQAASAQEKAAADGAAAQKTAAAETETAARQAAAAQETAAGEGAAAEETAAEESATANETAAATSSGSWIAASGRMIASAAKWVAQSALKAAAVVAENIGAAAETAAAWIAANGAMLLGAGLVVVAVGAAVYEIVKHWKTISKAVAKVWDEVYGTVSKAVAAVISFVKSHWSLIVSVITGPLGIIVTQVISHWNDIKKWFSDGVHAVQAALAWFGRLPGLFAGWIGGAAREVTGEGQKVLSWFSQLPGRVLSFLAKLGPDMLNAGKNAILGLVRGIESMFGSVGSVMSHLGHLVENTVKSVLGIASPSAVMALAGQMVASGLAKGVQQGTPQAVARGKAMALHLLSALRALNVAKGGQMRTAGQGLPEGLAEGLEAGSPKAIAQATQMAARTIAATAQLNDAKAGKMHAAGQGLVQGIWNGISASTSWLLSNVASFASNVLHGISSALGIGSPSRYTTEHGKMLGEGMANGMLASLPRVLAAGRQMARAALSGTAALAPAGGLGTAGQVSAAGLSGASLAALPAGSAGGGGGNVIHVNINEPHLMSDADMDKFVHKLGARLATQILPAAGVNIYPRH